MYANWVIEMVLNVLYLLKVDMQIIISYIFFGYLGLFEMKWTQTPVV